MHQEFILKDGYKVLLRNPVLEDAEKLIEYVKACNAESRFLSHEPGEFRMTVQQECDYLRCRTEDACCFYLIAEVDGEVVGACDAVPQRNLLRFRHRAVLALSVSKAFLRLGIGRLLLTRVLDWCREAGYEQAELEVVVINAPAIALYESVGFPVTGVYKNALNIPTARMQMSNPCGCRSSKYIKCPKRFIILK